MVCQLWLVWCNIDNFILESALEEELTRKVRVLCETNKLWWQRDRKWVWEAHSPFVRWKERKGKEMTWLKSSKLWEVAWLFTIISTSSFEWGNGRRKFIKVYFDFTILCFWSFSFFVFYRHCKQLILYTTCLQKCVVVPCAILLSIHLGTIHSLTI